MQNKSQRTKFAYLILGILWLFTLILIWPRSKPELAADEGTSHQAPADDQAQAAPKNQDQPSEQMMEVPTSTPLSTPLPTPIPTPVPSPTPEPLLIVLHTVQPGDTVYSIAQTHKTSVGLLAIRLTAIDLTPGNTIQVPVPNPAACPSGKLHVVEENQTLYGLSRLYNVKVEDLMSANGLANDMIHIGNILCLPPGGF